MAESAKRYYIGAPEACDVCKAKIGDTFTDGKTSMGPWANMCPSCHDDHGVGVGTGRGQTYKREADGRFAKVAG